MCVFIPFSIETAPMCAKIRYEVSKEIRLLLLDAAKGKILAPIPTEKEQRMINELKQAESILHSLSPERLRTALDFLAYLRDREADEATAELLAIPGFREELAEAQAEVERGETIRLEDLKANAHL